MTLWARLRAAFRKPLTIVEQQKARRHASETAERYYPLGWPVRRD